MKHRILIFFFLLFSLTNTFSSGTKIYLTTIGPGDPIFLRWGHFAIIVDYQDRRDLLFDYGNFSFEEDEFVPNFIRGIMTYFKYKKYADIELDHYILENRNLTLYELNLTPSQIRKYESMLFNEVRGENMFYQYDHYYNNCVSQMTNFIDTLTDGAFYKDTDDLTGRSFRDYSRDYVSSNYFYNTLIMYILGSKVDHMITEKESLFLPDNAGKRATKVYIKSEDGEYKPLIRQVLHYNVIRDETRDPVIPFSRPKTVLNLFIGILLALIILLINRKASLSAFIQVITGFGMGIFGTILFFMAFFTGHYYIHDNFNLVYTSPLSFILMISGILRLGKSNKITGESLSYYFNDLTLVAVGIMLLLKAFGIIYQANGEIITLLTPLFIANSSIPLLFKESLNRK